MENQVNKNVLALGLIALAIVGALITLSRLRASPANARLDAFAACLAEKKITLYGADWCPHCQNEKNAFGRSFRLVPYVECSKDPKRCLAASVSSYPTWIFSDGKRLEGEQGLEALARESGCPLPSGEQGSAPDQDNETTALMPDRVRLPIRWLDLGAKLVWTGVIDPEKWQEIYLARRPAPAEARELLNNQGGLDLYLTQENAGVLLNLFWAVGFGNRNDILEKGPMSDPSYGGADGFASTAGWTLARGDAMDHYSRHTLLTLTPEQQILVERVAKNIYRPCCDNSTYFPDCNHGMAMLGLLELMASQGVSEEEMYKSALQVNTYWFPDTYRTIAQYLASRGIAWSEVQPKEILGANYSSGSGYQQILSKITAPSRRKENSCGV